MSYVTTTISTLSLVTALFFSGNVSAHTGCYSLQHNSRTAIAPVPTGGTFQVIWTSVKNRDYFGAELYVWIEENRHQNEVKYFALTEDTFIMILPSDEINEPLFVPLEEVYVYDEDFKLEHK